MQDDFLFSGFGGQGVMFAGQLLAYAAMGEGFNVTWIPSYGPEMRGGTAHCFVIVSQKPIAAPVTRHPKVGVIFNTPSFTRHEPVIASGGLLVVNSSLVTQTSQRTDLHVLTIAASALAEELGNVQITNAVLLGATLTAHPVLPLEAVHQALDEHLPARRRHLLALNHMALDRGAALARDASS